MEIGGLNDLYDLWGESNGLVLDGVLSVHSEALEESADAILEFSVNIGDQQGEDVSILEAVND